MLYRKLLTLTACFCLLTSCGKKDEPQTTNQIKNDEVKNDEAKNDEVKNDEVKSDEVKSDEVKDADDAQPEPLEGRSFKAIEPEPPIDTSAADALLKDVPNDINALKALAKSSSELSESEYEALLIKTKDCQLDDDNDVVECPASMALMMLTNIEGRTIQNKDAVLRKLARHSDPKVRGFVYQAAGNLCESPENATELMPLITNESESFPLQKGLEAYSGCTRTYRGIFELAKKSAASPDKNVRKGVARALNNAYDVEGASDIMKALLNDKDPHVTEVACFNAGSLHDDALAPIIASHINDAHEQNQSACMMGLIDMWIDYPEHTHTSKAAYDATVNFLQSASFTEKDSAWGFLDKLSLFASVAKFDAWKQNATWINDDALSKALMHIAGDEKSGYATRASALKAIVRFGSDETKKEIKKTIDAQKTDEAKRLLQSALSTL